MIPANEILKQLKSKLSPKYVFENISSPAQHGVFLDINAKIENSQKQVRIFLLNEKFLNFDGDY